MKTSQILPFRALAVGAAFMYEGAMWVKVSHTEAHSLRRQHFHPNTPVEC